MKIEKEEIVKLVLSLSPREQQEFVQNCTNDYDYVLLYKHILKYKDIKEAIFIEQLQSIKQELNPEKEATVNFSVIKSYLLEKLLYSLRSSYKTPESRVYNNLIYSDILKTKGLYDTAKNYLTQANNIAKENDLFIEELIYNRQISILDHFNFSESANIPELIQNEKYYTQLIDYINIGLKSYSVLHVGSAAVYHRIFPDESFFENVQLLEKVNDADVKSKFVKLILWIAQFTCLQAKGEEENANKVIAKIFLLWEDYTDSFVYQGHIFLKFVHAFLFHYAIARNKASLNIFFKNLDNLLIIFQKTTKSETEVFRAKEAYLILKAIALFFQNNHESNLKILALKEEFQALDKENNQRMRLFVISEKFCFVATNLRLNNYHETLNLIDFFRHNKKVDAKLYSLIYPFIHFAYLKSHYELGNLKFLKYEIEKSKKALIKVNCFHYYESEFFNLMKMLVTTPTSHPNYTAILTNFQSKFEILDQEPEYKNHALFFDTPSWIKSIILRHE